MWFVATLGCMGRRKIIELLVLWFSFPCSVFCLFLGCFGRKIYQKRRQPTIFIFTLRLLWQSLLDALAGSLALLASCRVGEVTSVSVCGKTLGRFEIVYHCRALEKSSWLEAKQTEKPKERKIWLLTWSISFIWNRKIGACTAMNHHPCSVPCFLLSW